MATHGASWQPCWPRIHRKFECILILHARSFLQCVFWCVCCNLLQPTPRSFKSPDACMHELKLHDQSADSCVVASEGGCFSSLGRYRRDSSSVTHPYFFSNSFLRSSINSRLFPPRINLRNPPCGHVNEWAADGGALIERLDWAALSATRRINVGVSDRLCCLWKTKPN